MPRPQPLPIYDEKEAGRAGQRPELEEALYQSTRRANGTEQGRPELQGREDRESEDKHAIFTYLTREPVSILAPVRRQT